MTGAMLIDPILRLISHALRKLHLGMTEPVKFLVFLSSSLSEKELELAILADVEILT